MSIDTKKLESTTDKAKDVSHFVAAFRGTNDYEAGGDDSAAVTAADLSTPFVVSVEEEEKLVASLREAATAAANPAVAQADHFWLLAAIRARKGDVSRAISLASNYIQWRSSLKSEEMDAARSEKMRQQLRRGIIFVTGNTDRDGRPVLNVRLRNQDPSTFSALDTMRMVSFVLEWILRTYPAAQTNGIVIVNDMSDVSRRNVDIRFPGVMQKAFSKTLPVRLASLNAVNPPLFVRAVLAIVSNFLSEKLKARIRVFGKGDKEKFAQFFTPDQIMQDLGMGGTAQWTEEQHEAWVEKMIHDCQSWGPFTANNV